MEQKVQNELLKLSTYQAKETKQVPILLEKHHYFKIKKPRIFAATNAQIMG
ncbi:MAG: hypothetical protein GY928_04990 [Colwellia sp.]|nr:hypothetical protein [Colwellia sp.]